jgi:uncharacterized protein
LTAPARWPYAVLAYVCVTLALIGVVVPGLPTTPFLLLAAWAANRGSRRLHDWLEHHPRFGPALADWREQRAVATRAKVLAVGFLSVSWAIMLWRGTPLWLLVPLAALFIGVAAFVVTRPAPASSRSARSGN